MGTTLVYADSTMVGTLSATYDSKNETVSVMFVGYSEGQPVIIGPTTWASTPQEFADLSAEDIGRKLCGKEHTLKNITKSTHTGKEMVAEAIISSHDAPILVGR